MRFIHLCLATDKPNPPLLGTVVYLAQLWCFLDNWYKAAGSDLSDGDGNEAELNAIALSQADVGFQLDKAEDDLCAYGGCDV